MALALTHSLPAPSSCATGVQVFEALYDRDIITEDQFQAWRNDFKNSTPGHDKALIQCAA